MTRLKSLILSLMLAFAGLIAPVALAQGTVVIAIDDARILRDSKAGKDIQNKLKNIQNQIRGEVDPTSKSLDSENKSLETEGKSLQGKLTGKTQQQVQSDTVLVGQLQAFEKKMEAFNKRVNDHAAKRQTVAQEFALTERQALVDFNKALEPVLQEVINEKKAQLVVNQSSVVFASPSIDVSSLVIQKLDARTPTINVTRQRAPAATSTTKSK